MNGRIVVARGVDKKLMVKKIISSICDTINKYVHGFGVMKLMFRNR